MEVHLDSEKEALLGQIASQRGLNTADELAQIVLSGYLEADARFIEAVNLGLAAADRGDFVEHEEVWANVEKILQS
jgi:predicted transcriptional regulator